MTVPFAETAERKLRLDVALLCADSFGGGRHGWGFIGFAETFVDFVDGVEVGFFAVGVLGEGREGHA